MNLKSSDAVWFCLWGWFTHWPVHQVESSLGRTAHIFEMSLIFLSCKPTRELWGGTNSNRCVIDLNRQEHAGNKRSSGLEIDRFSTTIILFERTGATREELAVTCDMNCLFFKLMSVLIHPRATATVQLGAFVFERCGAGFCPDRFLLHSDTSEAPSVVNDPITYDQLQEEESWGVEGCFYFTKSVFFLFLYKTVLGLGSIPTVVTGVTCSVLQSVLSTAFSFFQIITHVSSLL